MKKVVVLLIIVALLAALIAGAALMSKKEAEAPIENAGTAHDHLERCYAGRNRGIGR